MKNQLLHGDCLELMRDIPSESIDMIITDPPYTMTKRGQSCRPNWMPNSMGDNVFNGEIPDVKKWMKTCYRILKNKTHFYTFVNTNDLQNYLNAASESGFKLHNIITMIKDTKMPNRWYLKYSELILFFRKGNAKPINDMTSRDYFNVKMPKISKGKLHLTQKPIEIFDKFVLNSSEENQIILDPFAGSGTTAIAALNTNRRFICIEKDEDYFEIMRKRVLERQTELADI